jgi:two-component system, chemotaxis family, sensor kinase Cph1
MNSYSHLTKAELIRRLQQHESNTGALRSSLKKGEAEDSLDSVQELKELKSAMDEHSIVAITDPQGRITYVNDKFCAISKYSKEELLGQNHRIINSGHHPKEFFKEMWGTISKGQIWRNEIKNKAKDGSFYWVHTTIVPFKNSQGKIYQYVSIRTDITERKKVEEDLAEKNRELETMVYVASHDLRSPLVNIQGFSKELTRSCESLRQNLDRQGYELTPECSSLLKEDIPEAISFILTGVNKIDTLLSGLLRLSRLGRAALRVEKLNMSEMIRGILQSMEFEIKEKKAVVHVEPLPPCLGDSVQMNQVFSNLLNNALKYLVPERKGNIVVSGELSGKQVVYEVRDNGIGVASEHQAKIFEIFHRLNPSHTEGEGLGLTIAQRALERQGGKIWVKSTFGKGSSFFVSLPSIPS